MAGKVKVKLIGAVRRVDGVFHEHGAVVEVDKDRADRMIEGGSAEAVQSRAKKPDDKGDE